MSATAPARLLTTGEVAAMTGMSGESIRRYCVAGRLRHVRLPGGARRIDPDDARALAESLTLPPRTP